MKRLGINASIFLASFAFGIAASSFLNQIQQAPTNISERSQTVIKDQQPSTVAPVPDATPNREAVFGRGRLRIVPDEVQLKSERLRYEIHVRYPQIIGSNEPHIRRLNQRIKDLATQQYQWPLSPSKSDLRYYREKWPDVFNKIDVDYEIRSAADSLLSIYFEGYSYGIGAAHSVQYSFVVNYDLTLQKELKLSDIFNSRSKYLEFISRYCHYQLSKQSEPIFEEALTPKARNFASWNVMHDSIRFNFDECSVFACASDKQTVDIPFADLKQLLNQAASKAFAG